MTGEASDNGRIVAVTLPSEDDISHIMALKDKCERRFGVGIVLTADFLRSLNKVGVGAMAFMKGDRHAGFAFFYSFEPEEAEVSIFADPDEDWRSICSQLLDASMEEGRRRGHFRLLVMNDRRLTSGVDLIKRATGKLVFSEHRMRSIGTPGSPAQPIDLREVGNDDPLLREVELECHDHFYSKPDQRRYLAQAEGRPIGKIDVLEEGPDAELTGFCVLPWFRGKGFGKAILLKMVGILRAEGKDRITLDVQTDNDVALSLYLKSGFEEEFTIDYYAISLKELMIIERRV
jgi:GNAT superfamily N-acetyltransferase